tara:strand:- start:1249 stop:2559 length:1311 start_codon:yes stop_codon:yes gene_type:complete
MIEIYYIISEILFISIFFSLPILLVDKSYYIKFLQINFIDKISIILIIVVNLLFLFSILNINLEYFLYLYILTLFYLMIFNLKKIKLQNTKINYSFIILIIFMFLLSIDLADQIYFAWDAKSNWFFKTLNFYQNQKIENLKNFNNFDYPHLGSLVWSFFWKFPHGQFEYLGRIFYIFIYLLSILSISNCLKLEKLEKIIFSILLLSLTYSYELFSGLQDVMIFSLILLFVRFAFIVYEKKKRSNNFLYLLILIAIFNLLCWTKNEGIFYGLFLFSSLFFSYNFSKLDKKLIFFGAILVLLIRILLFKYYDNQLDPEYFQMRDTISFDIILVIEKLKTITFYVLIYVSQNPIYFITIPTLLYILYKYPRRDIVNFIFYFFILNFIFIYLTYMFKMDEVELLIKASMKRVIFQTSGFYFLIIIIYINNYSKLLKVIKK